MGGCGKTTLVRKAYNNEMVKRSFDCYGWITVSQAYTRENLFRSLIEELYKSKNEQVIDDLTTKDFGELGNIIDSYLLQNRYLVILDDVWDANALGAVISAFPENQLGSRIVQTTRNETVGTCAFGLKSLILRVQRLDESLSWELFCRKAFSSFGDSSCPKELEKTAKKLVAKCEGLPLAIVAMAGLMSSKKAKNEWLDVCNSLSWQLSNNHMLQAVESILLLSFNDLPDPLKYCFLYCSLFPHGYAIRRKRLIRLLIAEGFVQQDGRAKPKQVADSYIMELVFRSMLQVVVRNEFGRPKAFKMHDLLHELALSISEKEKFCTSYDGRVAIENISRRVSVQNGCEHLESYGGISQIRSLLAFMTNSASSLTPLLSRLHFIRVLDLENTAVEKLPEGVGNLFNLTYLNLKGTKVRKLPKSIRKLNNLQTLDIRHTLIKKLPKGIDELQNLEHLSMYRFNNVEKGLEYQYVSGTRASMKLKKLKKLEVMTCIEAKGDIIRQIGRMTQFTRVGISNLRQIDNEELCSAIQNLIQLQDLFLMASSEDESFGLNELQSPPPYLRNFVLAGKLQRVPHWFSRLENLTDLGLYWPRLEEDVLPHIAELPNLGKLLLCNAYIGGDQLHFSNGFKKLRFLFLLNMPQQKLISIDEKVMPDVQEMTVGSCESLTGLPRGIEQLKNLKTLVFPSSILDREGKDYWKVQHIPRINKW